jgi:glycosyltransferase involved in cell wall biosynthesis
MPKLPINLPKCLASLKNMQRIILIDSGSNDETETIAAQYSAEVVQFRFNGSYPKKRQWALDNVAMETPWVFLQDADEEMTPELEREILAAVERPDGPNAFLVTKQFHFMGKLLRFGGFSHSAVLLLRQGTARFEKVEIDDRSGMDMEVHERLLVTGSLGKLRSPLVHNDFKGLSAYIDRHNRYSNWEAAVRTKLLSGVRHEGEMKASLFGNLQEKRRWLKKLAMRAPFEPMLWFVYHYFIRLGFLEGRRGLIASQIRSQYINHVRSKMYEMRLTNEPSQVQKRTA